MILKLREVDDQLRKLTDDQLNKKIQQRFGSERVRLGIAVPKSKKRSRFSHALTGCSLNWSGRVAEAPARTQTEKMP
jgi:hypothetical protein